ncbi:MULTISPECIES: hypothetical protein [Thomasclavelia]|nr:MULTISPECIES: hypothetical protein [Thomasclavelia]DAR30639.1 MAG TPA: cysteine-rich protein [Caudoviricetes sp.]MBV3128402.1 hypothetical protein [Thomasclavelia ramosa]MBV3132188.1 hypothetical protein [Thomasclavelia ramosa]MBV3140807.1 hypothetical protein [Thomasclavelia ramosa]MBV3143886.1 hypothetical protein [Thomasclavelia ramosa]
MKKEIYCPVCAKRGKKKLLGAVEEGSKGTVYLWCKEDKKPIKIELSKIK